MLNDTHSEKSRLSLKKGDSKSRLIKKSEDEIAQQSITHERENNAPQVLDRVHAVREKVSTPKVILEWIMVFLIGGSMCGLLYGMQAHTEMLGYYKWVRNIAGPIIYVLLLVVAYRDTTMQGIFCLLFPPYAVYYAFTRADSYILRGAVLGLLIGLGVEAYYLGDASVVAQVQVYVNNVVQGGESLIDQASAKPEY